MPDLSRSFKLATAGVLIAALSFTIVTSASATDRQGWNRGDHHDRYDRHEKHRDRNQGGKRYGSYYKSPDVVVRPYVGFSYSKPYSRFYGSHYAPYRPYGYGSWASSRRYGRHYSGFRFHYSDHNALRFLGLTALGLVIFNELSEAQKRAHENALARGTTADVGDRIAWNQSGPSGNVIVTRKGQTTDGRPCREFQQEVIIDGKREQAYGTACMQPNGAWKVVNN